MRDKVTTRLCPQTFLMKKESRSGIELRPLCFKPAHKPSCRPPLVIPPNKSGKGVGLWMGPLSGVYTAVKNKQQQQKTLTNIQNDFQVSHQLFKSPTKAIQLLFTDTHSHFHLLAQPQLSNVFTTIDNWSDRHGESFKTFTTFPFNANACWQE